MILLCKIIIVAKFIEVNIASNMAETSNEDHGSRRGVSPMMMIPSLVLRD
jgi:hypothetical protein